MWVPVVLQDRALRLPSGRPQLRVLLVSGAVHQHCASDLTGRASKEAGEAIGRRGEAEGEEAARARKGRTEQDARGGNGDGERKRHKAKQRLTLPSAASNQQELE